MNALMDAGLIEQTVDGDEWVFSLSEKGRKAWQPYQDFLLWTPFISQIKEIQPIDSDKSTIYFIMVSKIFLLGLEIVMYSQHLVNWI